MCRSSSLMFMSLSVGLLPRWLFSWSWPRRLAVKVSPAPTVSTTLIFLDGTLKSLVPSL